MLWKKDSEKKDALYVDLFGRNSIGLINNENEQQTKKSDAQSLNKRKEGNKLFAEGKCLCFAENGSENISLAYANRSSCFLKLKMFKECLADIELAIKAGYPERLMSKLEQRKADCLKYTKVNMKWYKMDPKLCSEPNERFNYMANVVDIQKGANGEYSMVAQSDIDVGETIVIEKSFLNRYTQVKMEKCCICSKDNVNLMPCEKCTSSMFCSHECQNHLIHKHECGLTYSLDPDWNVIILREIRGILQAIEMFSSVDELIIFVEEAIANRSEAVPESSNDSKSKYREFLQLDLVNDFQEANRPRHIFNVYKLALDIPKIQETFGTEKHRRFLMHLISHHCHVICVNDYLVRKTGGTLLEALSVSKLRWFNHSCMPNVHYGPCNDSIVYITIRPIKEGEQLLASHTTRLFGPDELRRKDIWQMKQIICQCNRCAGPTATPAQYQRIISDPIFQYFSGGVKAKSYKDIWNMVEKCSTLMRKYGRWNYCDAIGHILKTYMQLLSELLVGFDFVE